MYDKKFRERAIVFKESGATFTQLKATFGIDRKTFVGWVKLRDETGSVVVDRPPQVRRRKIDKEKLKLAVQEKPDAYLEELAKPFKCSVQAVFYALKKNGNHVKKKTFTYAEKSEEKRKKFLKDLSVIPEKKRVYVDESGVNQCIVREFGRAFRGKKVDDVKRGKHFQRTWLRAGWGLKLSRHFVTPRA